jgi:DNA polymerase-3 subunit alpha
VDLRTCNKRVFEALIFAGALDGLGHRAQLAAALDGAMQSASLVQHEKASGQGSLFGDFGAATEEKQHIAPTLPAIKPLSEGERLQREKEILGFYISGHPLEPFRAECELLASHTVAGLGHWTEQTVSIGCVVTAVRRQVSKKSGAEFARLVVEDFSGAGEVLVFPEAWAAIGDKVQTDVPVLLKGNYSRRDQGVDNPTFIVESVTRLAELRTTGQIAVAVELAVESGLAGSVMKDVRAVAESHPGSAPLEVHWKGPDGATTRFRSSSLNVSTAGASLLELRALLGEERVRLVRGS